MPLYMVEHRFAERLELTGEAVKEITEIYGEEGVRWLSTFLTPDKKRSYCLYEAPSSEAAVAALKRAGVPMEAIVPVDEVRPEDFGLTPG